MTAEPTYNKHLAGLTAFFILGDAIISLPVAESGGASLLGFLVAALAAVALYFAALPLANRPFVGKGRGRLLLAPLLLAAAVYAFYNAGAAFISYTDFVNRVLLPETPRFLIAALFILIAAYLSSRRQEVILKLSLIFIAAAAVTALLFFLLSVKDYNVENIAIEKLPDLRELFSGAKPYLLRVSLPALLIPVYTALFTGEKRVSAPFFGLLTGLSIIALCLIESLLLFGAPFAKRLPFPLASAVSTVTVGQLFSRMDGIVYCLFFAAALIKTAVCMKLAYFALSKAKNCRINFF
ncbi:MAG: GerAB/ArcD/ProY family transporter [Acutalibacteraceae bacterium]